MKAASVVIAVVLPIAVASAVTLGLAYIHEKNELNALSGVLTNERAAFAKAANAWAALHAAELARLRQDEEVIESLGTNGQARDATINSLSASLAKAQAEGCK